MDDTKDNQMKTFSIINLRKPLKFNEKRNFKWKISEYILYCFKFIYFFLDDGMKLILGFFFEIIIIKIKLSHDIGNLR